MSGARRFSFLLALFLMAGAATAGPAVRGDAGARVEIFSDGPDRVWVAVDRDSDGAPEDLYAFVSREAALPDDVQALLPVELASANVTVSERRLAVEEARPGQRAGQSWELSIDPAGETERAEVERRGPRVRVTLADGAALGRYDLSGERLDGAGRPGRASFRDVREGIAPRLEPVAGKLDAPHTTPGQPLPPCPTCASGGAGSYSCSANCAAGLSGGGSGFTVGANGAVNIAEGCGVSCGAGYFACCNCSLGNFLIEDVANCRCVNSRCN